MSKGSFHFPVFSLVMALRRFGSGIPSHAVTNGERGGRILLEDIRARAPVLTGTLRDSYDMRVEKQSNGVIVHVGTDLDYSVFQEFGTIYQSGTPHVRPAIESRRREIIDVMAVNTIRQALGGV